MKSIHEIFAQIEIIKEILNDLTNITYITRDLILEIISNKLAELNAEAEKVSNEMEIAYKKIENKEAERALFKM